MELLLLLLLLLLPEELRRKRSNRCLSTSAIVGILLPCLGAIESRILFLPPNPLVDVVEGSGSGYDEEAVGGDAAEIPFSRHFCGEKKGGNEERSSCDCVRRGGISGDRKRTRLPLEPYILNFWFPSSLWYVDNAGNGTLTSV